MSGKLLQCDLSGHVGYCRMQKGTRPRFGSFVLEGPDLAWRIGQFNRWLIDEHTADPFDALGWERPLLTPKDTVDKLELLYGLVGVCYGFAGMHRMPWREVTVIEAKKALTGRQHAKKEEMIFAAQRFAGWRVKNDHEADAGAGGLVTYARIWP